jgi:hypothetical protein
MPFFLQEADADGSLAEVRESTLKHLVYDTLQSTGYSFYIDLCKSFNALEENLMLSIILTVYEKTIMFQLEELFHKHNMFHADIESINKMLHTSNDADIITMKDKELIPFEKLLVNVTKLIQDNKNTKEEKEKMLLELFQSSSTNSLSSLFERLHFKLRLPFPKILLAYALMNTRNIAFNVVKKLESDFTSVEDIEMFV